MIRSQSIRVVVKLTFDSPLQSPTAETDHGIALYHFYAQTTQNGINNIAQLDRLVTTKTILSVNKSSELRHQFIKHVYE